MAVEMANFWDAAKEGRLIVPSCEACGHRFWPPAGVCPECLSRQIAWTDHHGRGRVWSFVEYHRAYRPELAAFVPYNVALVELDESQIRLISHVVDTPTEAIKVGMAVEVAFRSVFSGPDIVPVFRPSA